MPTTTSPLTPATHGLRVAASFNVLYGPIHWVEQGRALSWESTPRTTRTESSHKYYQKHTPAIGSAR